MNITQASRQFCIRFKLQVPILLAPMSGASAPSLSVAVCNAGGLGACGALMMTPREILAWASSVRECTNGPFQINLWVPDPPPERNRDHEAHVREFLGNWGPPVPVDAGDATPPDFGKQCEAVLEAAPPIVSSVMGLFPSEFVKELKGRHIAWFANISTVAEAVAAEQAGADVIVAQGMEAGGHRGCFNAEDAEDGQVGLFALLPSVVDAVKIPTVATGGIADARGVAAAFVLGASAVQIGTAFLLCPEAQINPAWAAAIKNARPEETVLTRAFSGRAGRSIRTAYVRAAHDRNAPLPAPYPVQRGLTAPMRAEATMRSDVQRMQAWSGQAGCLAKVQPAAETVRELWEGARQLIDIR